MGIPAAWYGTIYVILLGIITLNVCWQRYSRYSVTRLSNLQTEAYMPSFIFAIFITLFIGFRPISGVFMDMGGYAADFMAGRYADMTEFENFLFDRWRKFLCVADVDVYVFFVSIAIIYFMGMWVACRMLFPADTTLSFLVCLAAFSTFSYGTNGIKAGSAMSLFLIAIALKDRDKKLLTALFLWLSLGFHHSMILPLCAFGICMLVKNQKFHYRFWIFCVLMALFHVTAFQSLFASFSEEGHGYITEVSQDLWGKRGFRPDFILYSAMPVVVGYFVTKKHHIQDEKYNFILNLYTFLNAIWMLCMYANFTNRIAYLSWGIYPVALIYPFLRFEWKSKQYKTASIVAILHWLFTFFMTTIYYVFIEV